MRKRHGQVRPEMECAFDTSFVFILYIEALLGHEMDVRNLSFQAESFDIAIDKGVSYLNHKLNISIVTAIR